MEITIKVTEENDGINQAKRLLSADEAFSLLWDIDELCRNEQKWETPKTKDEILEEVRNMISESTLMDLYI